MTPKKTKPRIEELRLRLSKLSMKNYWKSIKYKNSFLTLWIIILVLIATITKFKPWQNAEENGALINWDVTSYYAYLPATFIEDDITLSFIDQDSTFYWNNHQYWPETAPNGAKVIKTTMGLSILYSPFFAVAHQVGKIKKDNSNGFSSTYEFYLVLSSIFYTILGIIFLRLFLLKFYADNIVSITLICIYIGTNLFYYETIEPILSHSYNFSLVAIFLFLTVKWHESPTWRNSLLIGLVAGLITLIRPINLIIILYFAFYNLFEKDGLKSKLTLFRKQYLRLILITLISFIVILPQLLYWKEITGNWFFNSYVGERFYFNNPHIIDGLFSFRKGWLLYTPIMTFALIGIFIGKRINYSVIFILVPAIIVLFSWWNWWYGGSFGSRPMIDFYPLLAICFATFIESILKMSRSIKVTVFTLIGFFIFLNLFQTMQYKSAAIHWDSMTKEAYFHNFMNRYPKPGFEEKLQSPNIEKALLGEDEY
jgi:hypothetical protein